MPAKSAAQQKAAGAALSAKRGDTPKSNLKGASKSMAASMGETERKTMASTSRKGKAEHKSKKWPGASHPGLDPGSGYFQPRAFAAFSATASKGSPAIVESSRPAKFGSIPAAMR